MEFNFSNHINILKYDSTLGRWLYRSELTEYSYYMMWYTDGYDSSEIKQDIIISESQNEYPYDNFIQPYEKPQTSPHVTILNTYYSVMKNN